MLALHNLKLKLRRVALYFVVQSAVFVDAAQLRGQNRQYLLVLFAELLRAQLVSQPDPTIGMGQRHYRRHQARIQRRIVRRKSCAGGVASRMRHAAGAAFGQRRPGPAAVDVRAFQLGGQRGLDAAGKGDHLAVDLASDTKDGVLGTDQVACTSADFFKQKVRIAFRGNLQIEIRQGAKAPVRGFEFRDFFRQLVGHQAQVFAIEQLRVGWRHGLRRMGQGLIYGEQNVLRLAGFDQHPRDTAGPGQIARLAFAVVRAVENNLGGGQRRIRPQLPHEFVAVHGRHQDVRNHQFGALLAHQRQRLGAIGGLQRLVTPVVDQRYHQFPVFGVIVDHQYFCHSLVPRLAQSAVGSKASICPTKVSGTIGFVRC